LYFVVFIEYLQKIMLFYAFYFFPGFKKLGPKKVCGTYFTHLKIIKIMPLAYLFYCIYRVKNKNYAFLCFLFPLRIRKLGPKKGVSGYVLKFILFKILKFPFFKDFIIFSFSNLFFYLLPDTKKIRIIIENRTGKREHKKA